MSSTSKTLPIGKYKQTCRYDIDKQTCQTCLSEDQKHVECYENSLSKT